MLNSTIEESIKRNWNNVLKEHLIKEDIQDEGLSDVAAWMGDKQKQLADKLGFDNPKRDQFIAKNKKKNVDPHRKGSKAVTALNLLGKGFSILTGKPGSWSFRDKENKHGGYFDKTNPYDHEKQVNELEGEMTNAINSMVSYLALLRQLKYVCSPTKLGLKEVNSGNGIGQFIQFGTLRPVVSPNGSAVDTLTYGSNLLNGKLNSTEQGQTDLWNLSQQMSNVLSQNCFGKTKKFVKGKNFEWMEDSFKIRFQHANIDVKIVNDTIGMLGHQLDNIDSGINRVLWDKGYKNYDQAINDPEIVELVQKKVDIVNREINRIVELPKQKSWSIYTEDNTNILPWFIDLDKLYKVMYNIKMDAGSDGRALKDFLQQA